MSHPANGRTIRCFLVRMVHNSSTRYQSLGDSKSLLIYYSSCSHSLFFCFCLPSRVGRMRILPIYTIRLAMDMHSLLTTHSILTSLALILLSLLPSNTTLFLLTRMLHRLLRLFRMHLTLISSRAARQTLWWRPVRQLIGVVDLTGEDPGTETLQQLMGCRGIPLQQIL